MRYLTFHHHDCRLSVAVDDGCCCSRNQRFPTSKWKGREKAAVDRRMKKRKIIDDSYDDVADEAVCVCERGTRDGDVSVCVAVAVAWSRALVCILGMEAEGTAAVAAAERRREAEAVYGAQCAFGASDGRKGSDYRSSFPSPPSSPSALCPTMRVCMCMCLCASVSEVLPVAWHTAAAAYNVRRTTTGADVNDDRQNAGANQHISSPFSSSPFLSSVSSFVAFVHSFVRSFVRSFVSLSSNWGENLCFISHLPAPHVRPPPLPSSLLPFARLLHD